MVLKIHARRIAKGHEMTWYGYRQCTRCDVATHRLPKTVHAGETAPNCRTKGQDKEQTTRQRQPSHNGTGEARRKE